MSTFTQEDLAAAQKFWDGFADDANSWGHLSGQEIDHMAQSFCDHRQIELTDAMLEAGAKVHYNRSHKQAFRKDTVAEIFIAMMGAHMNTGG